MLAIIEHSVTDTAAHYVMELGPSSTWHWMSWLAHVPDPLLAAEPSFVPDIMAHVQEVKAGALECVHVHTDMLGALL